MAVSPNAHVKVLTNVGDPLLLVDGTPVAGVKVKFQLVVFGTKTVTSAIDAVTGELVASTPSTVLTDVNGEFTVNLWPNSRGTTATAYYVTFSKKEFQPFFILVQDDLGNSLLEAVTAYGVGSGAISTAQLAELLYASDVDITWTGNFRNTPIITINPPGGIKHLGVGTFKPSGKFIAGISYDEGSLSIPNLDLLSLNFNDVEGFSGGVSVRNTKNLQTVTAPVLRASSAAISFTSNEKLSALNFPNLEYCALNLTIQACALLTSVNMPKLVSSFNISMSTIPELVTFNVPLLKQTPSGITMTNVTYTGQVNPYEFTSLERSGSIGLTNTYATFPVLSACTGSFTITSSLVTVYSLPMLEYCTAVMIINCANITTFEFPALKTIGIAFTLSGVGKLNQASVDGILVKLASLDGTNGTTSLNNATIELNGGTNATPSATGLAAKATLQARGCTVTHN